MRITAWPGVQLPVPSAQRRALRLAAGGALVSDGRAESAADGGDDHEVYLRLCDLDLDDDRALLAFARAQGPMGILDRERRWFKGLTAEPGFEDVVVPRLREATRAALAELTVPAAAYVETVEDFRWGAVSIRDLVRAWRWSHEGIAPARWESPEWGGGDPPADREAAGELLVRGLSVGLAPFQPRLDGPPAVSLYDVCCLELHNHVVERARYHVCENETCGRLFVRQSGRAATGRHRASGVKYCSANCARAQAQRAYRRRRSAAGV